MYHHQYQCPCIKAAKQKIAVATGKSIDRQTETESAKERERERESQRQRAAEGEVHTVITCIQCKDLRQCNNTTGGRVTIKQAVVVVAVVLICSVASIASS